MISNNLPKIQDCATQTEDGLMSYSDKIKLDSIDARLDEKLDKTTKITSAMMDTSTNANKIQPNNLSDEVKKMMTGTSPVSPTLPNGSVVNEYLADNAVTYSKIDKRLLQGFVVSPSPINFIFDEVKLSINIPQYSRIMVDSVTPRSLVANIDTKSVTVNLNYPADHDGVNAIFSKADGTLELINYRKFNTVANTSILMAFIYYKDGEPSVVMNGQFTINGVRQGIGTESAGLFGTGRIVLDEKAGIIDFTQAQVLYLVINGVYNSIIQNQANIRLASYTADQAYCLYWDRVTGTLKTALANNSNTDVNIDKIAIIQNGRIVPFVPSGIWFSKPYIEAPYYTETFEDINTTALVCKTPANFNMDNSTLELVEEESFVALNGNVIKVLNANAPFANRDGIQLIWFDLDTSVVSITHYKDAVTGAKILLGSFWLLEGLYPQVSANFKYTVNGKSDYENDISETGNRVTSLENKFSVNIEDNFLLAPSDIYMVAGDELPLYKSSLVTDNNDGVETAIKYNKNGDAIHPVIKKFEDIEIESAMVGNKITLIANPKYDTEKYASKEVQIHSVLPESNMEKEVNILCIGDGIINNGVAKLLKERLALYNMRPTMVGTMVNSMVAGEGRDGWMYSTFTGASGRGVKPGTIMPQLSKGTSSILLNPFLRTATADDKAMNPNICYRQTGAVNEKSYYTDSNKNGNFYIFDFSKYLEVQAIKTPDIVTISIGAENTFKLDQNGISSCMTNLKQMVSGIKSALPEATIAIIPQYGLSKKDTNYWELGAEIIKQVQEYVNELGAESNVYIVPVWCHQNREFNYTTETVTDDYTVNTLTSESILDSAGLQEYANVLAAFIMNL